MKMPSAWHSTMSMELGAMFALRLASPMSSRKTGPCGAPRLAPAPMWRTDVPPTAPTSGRDSSSTATPSTMSVRFSRASAAKLSPLTKPSADASKAMHRPVWLMRPMAACGNQLTWVICVLQPNTVEQVQFRFNGLKAMQPASITMRDVDASQSTVTLGPCMPSTKLKRFDMIDPAIPVPAERCSQPPASAGPVSIMENSETLQPT
mmetsp:Transcript_77165/g.236113  ORF Transcript_77165/g.236113 Transcript_77165/m.236113 type:complete len:206 (+) Transcript_77165:359-976(+)